MEKPDKSLSVKNESKKLVPSKSIMDWEPIGDLKEAIVKSWGLENINERSSSSRPK
jgi:hypothetical protein